MWHYFGYFVNCIFLEVVSLQFVGKNCEPINSSEEQNAKINTSISKELISNQSNQVKSIPDSDDVKPLNLVNKALGSELIYNNEYGNYFKKYL